MKERLESGTAARKLFVSMLRAEQWVDLQDVQPEDVVLQMARQLVTDLKAAGFGMAETTFRDFFGRLRDLLRSEVRLEGVDLGADPLKFSLAVEAFSSARQELRRLLQGQLPTIYGLVNSKILAAARRWLAEAAHGGYDDVLVIVDELDRIPQKVISERASSEAEPRA